METEAFHRTLNDGKLALLVIMCFGHDKREIQVAVVVVNRTASRSASHQVAAVALKRFDIHLAVRILVLSDDDSAPVAPQIQGQCITVLTSNKVILDSDIPIGVGLRTDDKLERKHLKIE